MNNANCGVSVVRANSGNNFFTQDYRTIASDSCTNTVYQFQNWELSNAFLVVVAVVLVALVILKKDKKK